MLKLATRCCKLESIRPCGVPDSDIADFFSHRWMNTVFCFRTKNCVRTYKMPKALAVKYKYSTGVEQE